METSELAKKVEAVLFAAGRKVDLEELKDLCKEGDQDSLKEAALIVKNKLDADESPLLLTEEVDGYKLTVREKFLPLVQQIMPETELGRSVLETLAIIAWKQPVLQAEVVNIRTSKAYEHIAELVDMGFITKNPNGRSFILKTTQKFAEYFDVPGKEEIKELFKDVEAKLGKPPEIPSAENPQLKLGGMDVYSEEQPEAKVEQPQEEGSSEEVDSEEKEEEEKKEEEEGEPEQMTEEMFEEDEKAPEEESALDALQESEKEETKTDDPLFKPLSKPESEEPKVEKTEAEEPKVEEPKTEEQKADVAEVEEAPQEEQQESKDEGSDDEERKLSGVLEDELKTEQPDFLHPKETIEEIEKEVEESKDIQEEEKDLEEEKKEERQEDIEVPEIKPEE